jgi:hypothetical protein
MLMIPHCPDTRLTDGGKVVNLTGQPLLYSPETLFSASGTLFCYRLSKHQSLVHPEGLGNLIKIIHLIGSQTLSLPACSIEP